MRSPYATERDMYQPVARWMARFLRARHRSAEVAVMDISTQKLASVIENAHLQGLSSLQQGLPLDWPTWEIQVDVVGFVQTRNLTQLAFAECKNVPLTLDHLAQLLGYARIARPQYAFLLSPQGVKRSLVQLLKTHQRLDVLEFATSGQPDQKPRSIVVAGWNASAETIAVESIITSDLQKVELGRYFTA